MINEFHPIFIILLFIIIVTIITIIITIINYIFSRFGYVEGKIKLDKEEKTIGFRINKFYPTPKNIFL